MSTNLTDEMVQLNIFFSLRKLVGSSSSRNEALCRKAPYLSLEKRKWSKVKDGARKEQLLHP